MDGFGGLQTTVGRSVEGRSLVFKWIVEARNMQFGIHHNKRCRRDDQVFAHQTFSVTRIDNLLLKSTYFRFHYLYRK